jgi:hypothetical protein
MSRMISGATLAALALLALCPGRGQAQYVVYTPRPAVTYYYAPPPTVTYVVPRATYYVPAAPVYVAPATTVTTYRYGAILPRRRVTVTTYYTPQVSYGPVYYR